MPSRIWRQNGANLSQNLLLHSYRNLRASKTTFILKISQIFSGASYLPASGACICSASSFPYSNMEGQKTTSYFSLFEKLSLLLYRNIQSKIVNTASKLFPLSSEPYSDKMFRGLHPRTDVRLYGELTNPFIYAICPLTPRILGTHVVLGCDPIT